MYRVYIDEILVYDLQQEIVLIDPVVKLEDSKSGSFDFGLAPDNPGYNQINKLTSVIKIVKMENDTEVELYKGRALEVEKDFYNVQQVSCEGELAFLLDSIQRPAEYHDMTVRGLLQSWIDKHNKQVLDDARVAVKFNSLCAGEGGSYDTVSIYYRKNSTTYAALNNLNCAAIRDKTFVIPSTDFWVYWKSDSSNTGWGFEIDSIALTNDVPLVGVKATIPSVTGVETTSCSTIKTSHPYANNEKFLWHYTHPIADDTQGAKTFRLGMRNFYRY